MPDEWMTGQELMDAYGLTVTEIAEKFFYERGKPFCSSSPMFSQPRTSKP